MSLQDKEIIVQQLRDPRVKKRLQSHQIKKIRLTGSYSTNTQTYGSDIDLIYEKDSSVSFDNWGVLGAYSYLKNKLKRNIDLIKKENIQENIKDSILSAAIPIW